MKVDVIFVVLTYRVETDLIDFFASLSNCDGAKKVIVVNAYYDGDTSKKIQSVASQNQADFIEVENKGYSYGNNAGIQYAMEHYEFKYLVIANPDTEIQKFSLSDLSDIEDAVLGPRIQTLNGRAQNPMILRRIIPALYMEYLNRKAGDIPVLWGGRVVNRIMRIWANYRAKIGRKKCYKTYMLHGSFVIFPQKVLQRLGTVYDEKMFLFGEESYLAERLRNEHILSFWCPEIIVKHKEDSSMSTRNDVKEISREATLYVYETYYGFGKKVK